MRRNVGVFTKQEVLDLMQRQGLKFRFERAGADEDDGQFAVVMRGVRQPIDWSRVPKDTPLRFFRNKTTGELELWLWEKRQKAEDAGLLSRRVSQKKLLPAIAAFFETNLVPRRGKTSHIDQEIEDSVILAAAG